MIGPSRLVTAAVEAITSELQLDPEVLSVPVDHSDRAVAVIAAPDLLVAKVDTSFDRVVNERRALRQLADALPVPKVLFATEESPWVTGLSFQRGEPIDRCDDPDAWRTAGRHLRTIHETTTAEWARHPSHPDSAMQWVEDIGDAAAADGPLSESAIKEFRRVARSRFVADCEPTAVHGDFSTQHVLVAESMASGSIVTGLIDLGDAGVGDPAYDIATLTLWHPDRVDDVVAGYGVPVAQERLDFYRLVRLAAGAQWLHDFEFDPTPFVVALYEELLG